MRLFAKILLPLLVLAMCGMAARAMIDNRPEPTTRPSFKSSTAIEATRVEPESYTVTLNTRGEVGSANAGTLVAEVDGGITEIADNFVVGGSFRQGDVLARVDPRDYEIELTLARANYAQVQAVLAEEQARAEQAADDWKTLGRKGTPSDLTLRKPQLAAARANLEGALGQVQRAELNLDRTNIRAMYDGRVRSKQVSLGQYVNRGSALGEIFSTGSAEIRLPFSSNQLQHIDLDTSIANRTPVQLTASVGGTEAEWSATLVRAEGIDATNRQFYVIARIDNPYVLEKPLRVGQYVEAKVTGNTLDNVFVIPRSALREDKHVLIVDEIGTLQTREVVVAWKDADVAVINSGLESGDILNITSLGSVTNGTRVKATIDGVAPQEERRGRPEGATGQSQRNDRGNDQKNDQENNKAKKSNGNAQENEPASSQEGNPQGQQSNNTDGRMLRLKAMVDAGEELPPQAVERIQKRITAGEELPPWLIKAVEAAAK